MSTSSDWAGGYRVETPEGIDLDYDVAGLGSRFVAALVDTVILFVLLIFLLTMGLLGIALLTEMANRLLNFNLESDSVGGIALAIILLLTFALIWGYYVFFEWIWEGRTPGKRISGLRVIKDGGYPLGFLDVVIRNVIRFVDFLPVYYMLGAGVMLFNKQSRRLGDLAAGTLVIKERSDIRLASLTAASPTATPGTATPRPDWVRLTPAEESLLRDFLDREPKLLPEVSRDLSARLAAGFAAKFSRDLDGEAPLNFLRRVAGRAEAPAAATGPVGPPATVAGNLEARAESSNTTVISPSHREQVGTGDERSRED